jgi:hypothetical protein
MFESESGFFMEQEVSLRPIAVAGLRTQIHEIHPEYQFHCKIMMRSDERPIFITAAIYYGCVPLDG